MIMTKGLTVVRDAEGLDLPNHLCPEISIRLLDDDIIAAAVETQSPKAKTERQEKPSHPIEFAAVSCVHNREGIIGRLEKELGSIYITECYDYLAEPTNMNHVKYYVVYFLFRKFNCTCCPECEQENEQVPL